MDDPKTHRNRTEELKKRELCRLNCEMPIYLREAIKAQALAEDLHLHQLCRRYIRDGLRAAGWDI